MDPERREHLKRLFERAIELPAEARTAFLDESCANDPELRAELSSLLKVADEADPFFDELGDAVISLPSVSEEGFAEAFSEHESFVGRTVHQYRIEEKLGSGGMGVVYRAHDTQLDRTVALKFLPRHVVADEAAAERFVVEARAAAALDHPNVCMVHEISRDEDGRPFIAMAYYDGETLKQKLEHGPLPIEEALDYARQIGAGLAAAHTHDIIHRDIKPGNVIVTPDGVAKVLDFGLAKLTDVTLTGTGTTLGTLAYMSPEQIRGEELDARTDLWSLGVVLYELLTGQRPFGGGETSAVIHRILHEAPKPPSALRPEIPAELEPIVGQLLAKDPEQRPATAEDLGLDGGPATLPKGVFAKPTGWARLRSRRGVAAVVAGATALGVGWWAVAGPGAATPQIASLVVLPFDNLSADPEQEYFVDGMHEAVIGELARIGALNKVISRTSAMQYKERAGKSLPEIARELNVDAVLEGSVLRAGDRVRITLQLIEGREDRHLWAESYERDLGDVLALQSEVARAVARGIEVALSPAERERIELAVQPGSARRPDPEAYDAYLKGRYHFARPGEEGFKPAIRYYEEAIAKDPTFARAYAALAQALFVPAVFEPERGGLAARTALDLDPALPEAHAAVGRARMVEWDWTGSEAAFQRAIELNPNSSVAHQWYVELLRRTMRLDEALSEARRAAELDPLSLLARTMVGWVLMDQRRYDEALEVYDEVLELEPEYEIAIFGQGHVYGLQGRGEDVISAARRAKATRVGAIPDYAWTGLLGVGYALSGQRERAEEILGELEASYAPIAPGLIAYLHHILGDDDKALDWLEKGYEVRSPAIPLYISGPQFDDLRAHPRFRKLHAKMGLP